MWLLNPLFLIPHLIPKPMPKSPTPDTVVAVHEDGTEKEFSASTWSLLGEDKGGYSIKPAKPAPLAK
ncbi:hypothetical protein BEN47_06095 [Hymenobacter lapidarius]|uniref:Uncharacterized protein n=1 Tax=Hymenobacter lapidarius TaxID=1908237 RepID=A0A1G1SQC8_9BACT|nr:hypothetical protein BEN47_06095 [Hymenobacter lapidarius]